MNRLLKDSKDLRISVHIQRWYILFFLLFLGFSAIFELSYRFNIKTLRQETLNIPQTKLGKNIEIALFKENKLIWLLQGGEVNFSNPQVVVFFNFKGRNLIENYSVSSQKAYFYIKDKFIKLVGDVVFKTFSQNGRLLQLVRAKNAYIDLKNKKVWGTGRVIVRSGNRLITGYDYIYKIKEGKFIILRDVATTFIND